MLGLGVYFFLFKERKLFSGSEAAFRLPDTASVGKIYLSDKSGHSVTLTRTENGWLLNNQYRAAQAPINTLLRTIALQDAMYPVPEGHHNAAVKSLSAKSVKTELYNRQGELIRTFYVGGQANEGTYMLMEGAKRPYVVQIANFPGYLTPRYSTAFDDWRDRTVSNIPQEELKTVHVEYIHEPLNSFTVSRSREGNVTVSLDPSLNFNPKEFNAKRAASYTGFFSGLYCEGYLNGTRDLDSLVAGTLKRCVVDIEGWKGQKQHMEVYWIPLNKRSKNQVTPFPGAPADFDADRFYAIINDFKDTTIIQRQMFEKVFRKGYEFYQADSIAAGQP